MAKLALLSTTMDGEQQTLITNLVLAQDSSALRGGQGWGHGKCGESEFRYLTVIGLHNVIFPKLHSLKIPSKQKLFEDLECRCKVTPIMDDDILIDGVAGFIHRRYQGFQLDFSQYITLVEQSYIAQTSNDKELKWFVPASAYTYYMVILLWKRILQTTSHRGNSNFENLSRALPHKLPVPKEVRLYLDSIGGGVDPEGLEWRFNFTPELTYHEFFGAWGS